MSQSGPIYGVRVCGKWPEKGIGQKVANLKEELGNIILAVTSHYLVNTIPSRQEVVRETRELSQQTPGKEFDKKTSASSF